MTSILHGIAARWRWILLPVLAFVALVSWAFASPVGAGPDDDYHLVSVWCAGGGSDLCKPGSTNSVRMVSAGFESVICYVGDAEQSADCQDGAMPSPDGPWVETARGNFVGEYPPVYYATMRLFAGDDVESSALVMRLVNAALFVLLSTAVAVLLPRRRRVLLWAWLITLVPLGMFLIPSNNPSGWAITGVGTAFLAMVAWYEAEGWRRLAGAGTFAVAVVMAAGARGDGAVYVVGAAVTATIVSWRRTRGWWSLALPFAAAVAGWVAMRSAGQSTIASGFTSTPVGPDGVGIDALSHQGLELAAYNLLKLPFLWTGVFGSWALGWFDTTLPPIVPWAAAGAFIAVGFVGLGLMTWRKAVSLAGVLGVLVVLPVYVLTSGGNQVGENLQPRYLLPLIVLLGFLLVWETPGGRLHFTRLQTLVIMLALATANMVALQVNTRRYVTGVDLEGPNLDRGAQWWWSGVPWGPGLNWVLGTVAYAGVLAVAWRVLRDGGLRARNEQPVPAQQSDSNREGE